MCAHVCIEKMCVYLYNDIILLYESVRGVCVRGKGRGVVVVVVGELTR